MAEDAGKRLQARLTRPSLLKKMTKSQVRGGFWLGGLGEWKRGLPDSSAGAPNAPVAAPTPTHTTHRRAAADLELEHRGEHWPVRWLADKAGFSGGWGTFARDQKLLDGDYVLFEQAAATRVKAYILRHADYTGGSGGPSDDDLLFEDAASVDFKGRGISGLKVKEGEKKAGKVVAAKPNAEGSGAGSQGERGMGKAGAKRKAAPEEPAASGSETEPQANTSKAKRARAELQQQQRQRHGNGARNANKDEGVAGAPGAAEAGDQGPAAAPAGKGAKAKLRTRAPAGPAAAASSKAAEQRNAAKPKEATKSKEVVAKSRSAVTKPKAVAGAPAKGPAKPKALVKKKRQSVWEFEYKGKLAEHADFLKARYKEVTERAILVDKKTNSILSGYQPGLVVRGYKKCSWLHLDGKYVPIAVHYGEVPLVCK